MKVITKQNVKIDWTICAVCDDEQRNNPESVIAYYTVGYSKYGNGEIVVVGKVKNHKKIKNLINVFGTMLASGEEFASGCMHCIDNANGRVDSSFSVVYGKYDNGEKWIQLLPDFELDTYKNLKF